VTHSCSWCIVVVTWHCHIQNRAMVLLITRDEFVWVICFVHMFRIVKAIAALTRRTLIVLNLQHISSPQQLYECFHSLILAGEEVPHEERLYYIPEVDTQAVAARDPKTGLATAATAASAVLAEAESDSDSSSDDDSDTLRAKSLSLASRSSRVPKVKKPVLSLGDILNVLDGVPERHGHILIMVPRLCMCNMCCSLCNSLWLSHRCVIGVSVSTCRTPTTWKRWTPHCCVPVVSIAS
jgi:hypothetical protein